MSALERSLRPLLTTFAALWFADRAIAQPATSQPAAPCIWDMCYIAGESQTPDEATWTVGGIGGSSMLKITDPRNGRTHWVLLEIVSPKYLYVFRKYDPVQLKTKAFDRGMAVTSLKFGIISPAYEFNKADLTHRISQLQTICVHVTPFFNGWGWGPLLDNPLTFGAKHTDVERYAAMMKLKIDTGGGPVIGRVVSQDPPGGGTLPANRTIRITYDGRTYAAAPDRGASMANAIEIEDPDGDGFAEFTELLTEQHQDNFNTPGGGKEIVWKLPAIPPGTRVSAGRTDMGLPVMISAWRGGEKATQIGCASSVDPTLNFDMPEGDCFLVGEIPGREVDRLRLFVKWPVVTGCASPGEVQQKK